MKTYISLLVAITAFFVSISALEREENSIITQSSVQRKSQIGTLEKQYKKRLNAIRQEITMLKDSLMLVNPAVHAPKLQKIEAQFKALNDELEKKELLGRLSKTFMQELGSVEREIFDTKKLLGIKTPEEEMVEE